MKLFILVCLFIVIVFMVYLIYKSVKQLRGLYDVFCSDPVRYEELDTFSWLNDYDKFHNTDDVNKLNKRNHNGGTNNHTYCSQTNSPLSSGYGSDNSSNSSSSDSSSSSSSSSSVSSD